MYSGGIIQPPGRCNFHLSLKSERVWKHSLNSSWPSLNCSSLEKKKSHRPLGQRTRHYQQTFKLKSPLPLKTEALWPKQLFGGIRDCFFLSSQPQLATRQQCGFLPLLGGLVHFTADILTFPFILFWLSLLRSNYILPTHLRISLWYHIGGSSSVWNYSSILSLTVGSSTRRFLPSDRCHRKFLSGNRIGFCKLSLESLGKKNVMDPFALERCPFRNWRHWFLGQHGRSPFWLFRLITGL